MMGATLLFLFLQENDDLIGLVAVVGSYILVVAVAFLILWFTIKRREYIHKERLALIERAEALPPEVAERFADWIPTPEQDIRSGILWLVFGLGLCLVLYLMQETRSYWAAGLIGVFVGFGYLLSFFMMVWRRPKQTEIDHRKGGRSLPPPLPDMEKIRDTERIASLESKTLGE